MPHGVYEGPFEKSQVQNKLRMVVWHYLCLMASGTTPRTRSHFGELYIWLLTRAPP